MTEITDMKDSVPVAVRGFVWEWGNLGERWGVNRSVSQIHALLYASKKPLAAEEIADVLGIARSNVSNSLRELQSWNSPSRFWVIDELSTPPKRIFGTW